MRNVGDTTGPRSNARLRRRTGLVLPVFALVLVAASGCSSGSSTPAAVGSTVSPASAAAVPSGGSVPAPASSSMPPPDTLTSAPTAPSAPVPSSPPSAAGSAGTSPGGTPAASQAGLPRAADPRQGRRYWAVLGALSTDIEDPKLTAAEQQFRKLGYEPGRGELDCLQGARKALKVTGDTPYYEVDVLFSTSKQAAAVAAKFEGKVVGVARITAFCLD